MPDTNQNRAPERREPQPGARQEPKARRKRRRRPIWLTIIIRILQLIGTLLLIGVITGCFMVCFAAVYVKTVVMPNTYLRLEDYYMNENSVVYYEDKETKELVELQTLKGTESRELIEYEQLPEDLINAYIAVEDKRFPTHNGVDWKRTANGVLRMFTGGNIQGGSTITQQLIKNITENNDVTVNRKIQEIFTALELESNYTKKEILTYYLNEIYMGNSCRGVQAAAKYYFGKNVWELDLAECASLAGITNNPSLYAPYGQVEVVRYTCKECKAYNLTTRPDVCENCGAKNSYDNGAVWTNREYNKARQELILKLMADPEISPDGAYITEAERDAAIAETLVFTKDIRNDPDNAEDPDGTETKTSSAIYSWYVEEAIREATKALQESTHLSEDMCRRRVFSGGLKIITAFDPDVQAAVDAVYNDRSNLDQVSTKTGNRAMSSITVVDNSTGYVVALGSTAEKKLNRGSIWPVTTVRQPGSSIKPLSVYSPALEMGLISPATVVDDNPQLLNGNVWPTNSPKGYRGLTTVLDGLTRSVNTIALRVLDMVTPQAAYDYLTQRYGITSLEAYHVTSSGQFLSDIDRSPMSMGGLTFGISTFEMAAAYATFPRGGEFKKATTVLEIQDADGNMILDNRPEPQYVIKATTAYYINSMLTNVVNTGTGTAARLSGMTAAGKTGTTNNRFDLWFCGYTPYYTASVWTGFPTNERIDRGDGSNPSAVLWQKVMSRLHEGKENQEFAVPETLNTYQICRDCGKKALEECALDVRGSRIQTFRLFAADAPTGFCECHKPVQVCVDSPISDANGNPTGRYHKAGEFCPEESVRTVYMVDFQRELAAPDVYVEDSSALLSWYDSLAFQECAVHTGDLPPEPPEPPEVSSEPWVSDQPTWPPVESSDPFLPPLVEPTPAVTVDIPEPPVDPFTPPDEPYIPAGDDWGNTG
ncbi:MAG: transglycosylase [Clostridiales bacterium]|nr:transglycosylase [Clostridiales bacterium]